MAAFETFDFSNAKMLVPKIIELLKRLKKEKVAFECEHSKWKNKWIQDYKTWK